MTEKLLTTVVGSYPQPDWLVDRKNLQSRLPKAASSAPWFKAP